MLRLDDSEVSQLAKPAEREPDLGGIDFVAAGKRFKPDPFESSVHQQSADVLVFEWWRNWIADSAAEPDRNVQEVGWGMIGFVSDADSIVIDPGQKKLANFDRVRSHEHGCEKTAPLRAARKSGEDIWHA